MKKKLFNAICVFFIVNNVFAQTGVDIDKAVTDLTRRALTYVTKDEYDNAIADFTQAIKLNPNDATLYINRGTVYSLKKDYDRAILDYNQAIKLEPGISSGYKNRGTAYSEKKDYDLAIENFSQVLRMDPNDIEVYYSRGRMYAMKGEFDRTMGDWQTVLHINPNHANAKQAIDSIIQILKDSPNAVEYYLKRGSLYNNQTEDYNMAIAAFSLVLRLDANNLDAYYNRGIAFFNNKDYDKAITDWEVILRLYPDDSNLKKMIENAKQRLR